MRGISLKAIFIILIVILLSLAIYNSFFEKEETANIVSDLKSIVNEDIVSTNLRIGIIEFDNMNPILSNNKNIQDISRLIFEPLFTLTEEYKLKGVLAEECSRIDEKTYIIKLKENIKWQDGKKFDSSDVVFTIDILKKLGTSSIYYYNIKDVTLLEALDEYTIKLEIDKEIPYFEYNLIFPIVSSKYYNEENFWHESVNLKPIGTGIFYISEVDTKNILLKKNINNQNSKNLKLDSITLKLYDSLSKTIDAFNSEEIDIFTTSNKNIEEYVDKNKFLSSEYVNRNYYYLSLNCENKILSNKEVRQAINSSIDKESLLKNVSNVKYKISNFPLDFGSFAYDTNNTVIECDVNTAKRLLVENSWKYSYKRWNKVIEHKYLKIELDLIVNKSDSNMVKVANNVKEQLGKVGIIINIKELSKEQYNKYLTNKNYDMILINNNYGYSPSMQKFFGDNNIACYHNDEIKNILNEVKYITDEKELKQKYSRLVDLYNDEVPYISLFYNMNTMIYSNNLKGTISPNSYNLFYNIETWYREYKKK